MKQPRCVIKADLFAADQHREKIAHLSDPLAQINPHIDFSALAAAVDHVAPHPVSSKGVLPPFPTETMVRILVFKRLYNLSDEQMEFPLRDRMSYKRLCGLTQACNIPNRTTIWTFDNRISEAGAQALFDGVTDQQMRRAISRVAVDHRCDAGSSPQATGPPPLEAHHRAASYARGLEAGPAPPEGLRCQLDQKARQEPLRLYAVDQCG